MNDAAAQVPALGGAELATALRAGIHRVIAREETLNRINVFPVPDGDTGTNLALTLQAVLAALRSGPEPHAGRLLARVADAALDGARGNSGAILAQFLLGVAGRAGGSAALDARVLGEAVAAGALLARESLGEPREGTILTVLAAFAQALGEAAAAGVPDVRAGFRAALATARTALEATRGQLDALRRADVVDAGGLGFVELVAGMADFLETGRAPGEDADIALVRDDEAAAGERIDLDHRWCTECTVTGEALDLRRLREETGALGSSLVVAGTPQKLRLHVHTDFPERVFEVAARHGAVSGEKADDMLRQQQMAHHASRRRVAVVTDSAADLPDEVLSELDIHVVPARVHLGSRSYLDKVGLTSAEFFRALAAGEAPAKTSQPPPGDFRRAFEFLGSHYEAVVYVGLMARVSGTFASGETAAARSRTHARILTLDSGTAAFGQGLVVMRAAEAAAAGDDAESVRQAAVAAAARTRTWGCLATLEHAVRGGRVPRVVALLSRLLGVTPVLTVRPGGRVGVGGAIFRGRDRCRAFGRLLVRRLDARRRWRIGISHADAPEGAQAVRDALAAALPQAEFLPVIPLGTALGVHTGPGCIVVAAQELPAAAA